MRVMTIVGTRPEIIRLSRVIPLLDRHAEQILVHTGQNYDDRLSGLFFRELGVRDPDIHMGVRGAGFAEQVGLILTGCEPLANEYRPDRVLILGDTNSGLAALVLRRMGLPIYHMEAGNRCYDDRVPEEVNRRVIDHCSSVLMPYTNRSRDNLLQEGVPHDRVYVVGNPIKEVMDHYRDRILASSALSELGLEPGRYFLVTMHRAENVDVPERLTNLVQALSDLHARYGFPVICSLHPRTRSKMEACGLPRDRDGVRFVEPFGFFDFVHLERDAFCLLSDSGTVQEEACIMGVPNVTIRDVTERPETIECGSNALSGVAPDEILSLVELVTQNRGNWTPPAEYLADHVASTVVRILLGYRIPDAAEQTWRSAGSSSASVTTGLGAGESR